MPSQPDVATRNCLALIRVILKAPPLPSTYCNTQLADFKVFIGFANIAINTRPKSFCAFHEFHRKRAVFFKNGHQKWSSVVHRGFLPVQGERLIVKQLLQFNDRADTFFRPLSMGTGLQSKCQQGT
jgi:hypothetical protein